MEKAACPDWRMSESLGRAFFRKMKLKEDLICLSVLKDLHSWGRIKDWLNCKSTENYPNKKGDNNSRKDKKHTKGKVIEIWNMINL